MSLVLPSVAIVIVTHNSAGQIGACLDAIDHCGYDGPLQTIVVDQASTDETCRLVSGYASRVWLVSSEENRGFGAGCNLGIRETSSDLVLLLNPDTRLQPDALRLLAAHLAAHPRAGIVGPRLLSAGGTLQPDLSATGLFPSFRQALFEYTRLGRLWPESRWYRDYFLTHWNRCDTRRVAMVQGACFLMRRAILEDEEPLDERFFLYFEETDLCKRAAHRGWETHYVGEAACVHLGSQSMAERRPSARHFIASLYRFHRKHEGLLKATVLWTILFPYHLLRAIRLALVSLTRRGDEPLQRDLRTALERAGAHLTVPFAPSGRRRDGVWTALRLGHWRHVLDVRPAHVVVPAALAVLVAALEGLSLGLLVPLATGVSRHDFEFVRAMKGFSWVTRTWPSWFPSEPDGFAPLFMLVTTTAAASALARNVLAYASHVWTARLNGEYRRRADDHVFARALGYGQGFFDQVNIGRLQSVMGYTGDLLDVVSQLQKGLLTMLILGAQLMVMTWISWRLTLLLLTVFPLAHLVVRVVGRHTERIAESLNHRTLTVHADTHNLLSALPLFRAYAHTEAAVRRYRRANGRLRRLHLRLAVVQGVMGPFQEVMTLLTLLLLAGVVAFGIQPSDPSRLPVFLVFFYAAKGAVPRFAALYEVRNAVAARLPHLRELADLLDDRDKGIIIEGTREWQGLRESLSIRDLRFAYRGGRPALDGLTLTVPAGQVTGITGPSGSGKTTLVHLLMGFYAAPAGTILLDGDDLTTFRLDSVRRRTALVSQQVWLFNDSVRANLLVAVDAPVPDAVLWDALAQAQLADRVRALPGGLDTPIGDAGVQLSGGERQRLSICRAILRRPDLLILDEATSALDADTEQRVQVALSRLMAGRTTIVIAHRPSAFAAAHAVITLSHGRVADTTVDGVPAV
jgi:subfamily B ATP-binding cassette protein MsbA